MGTRNTPVLRAIIEVIRPQLIDPDTALNALENHFQDQLIVNAGNVHTISSFAGGLRLRITREECSAVMDAIAEKGMVTITVDQVETAVWEMLGNRFIEPGA